MTSGVANLQEILEILQTKAAGPSGPSSLRLNFTNSMVSAISDYTFAGCTELGIVAFPACEDVGAHAFDGCTNLASATVAEGIIRELAFNNCTNLQFFTMLSGHPFSGCIYPDAFAGCANLQKVTLLPETVVTLDDATVFSATEPEIWVPTKVWSEYQNDSVWQSLASSIRAIPD